MLPSSPRFYGCLILALVLVGGTACNELIGARRYQAADGSPGGVDAAAPDGSRPDSSTPDDGGPGIDAGDCDPADRETYFLDGDGDTYGLDATTVEACSLPAGYAERGGDCDDAVDTAFPGAAEVCDGVDSDCDGTTDEGLMGPVGDPFEIIGATDAGTGFQLSVAAYDDGYLAVSGGSARWLDATGAPSSDVFQHVFGGTAGTRDRVQVLVFEDTSPARGLIAHFRDDRDSVSVRAYSANEASTALSSLSALSAPTDPPYPDLIELDMVRVGDVVTVFGTFTGGDDDSLLRARAIDPAVWAEARTFDELFVRSYLGALPVASDPPSALLGVTVISGLAYEGELRWMTQTPGGSSIDRTAAATLGSSTRVLVPTAPVGVPPMSDTLLVVEDGAYCLHRLALPAAGSPITLGACPGAITWEPNEMHYRQGVVSVLTSAGGFLEEALAPGTGGTSVTPLPGVGSQASMAVREGRGLVVYPLAGALQGQRLGCVTP